MNLFFWRIFLSFWLANILIAGALIWTTGWIAGRDSLRPAERMQEYMGLSLGAMAGAVERGGLEALRQRGMFDRGGPQRSRRPPFSHPMVFDESGRQISGGKNRERGRLEYEIVARVLDDGGKSIVSGRIVHAARVSAPDGTPYVIALASRAPPNPLLALNSRGSSLRFLIALITSGAISFALARYFAGPIRRLRYATQQLASGDLTTQVAVPQGQGGDDLIQLGRDFNNMARKLKLSNDAQTQLMLDVSHELRSPLARLQIAVELLHRKVGDESAVEVERIELEASRLNGLIGEILTLTRHSGRGESGSDRELVDLSGLLEEVCEDGRFETGDSDSIRLLITAPRAVVLGSAEALRSCFENVIRNSVKHGGTPVIVQVKAQDSHLIVSVADRGAGVADDEIGRLFEPFFRTTDHTESGGQSQPTGFGLGLAIVKAVVDAHGGTVVAESPAGGGLEIRVALPAAVENSAT